MENDALFRRISAVSGVKRDRVDAPSLDIGRSQHLYAEATPEPDKPRTVNYDAARSIPSAPNAALEPVFSQANTERQAAPYKPYVDTPALPKGSMIELLDSEPEDDVPADVPGADPLLLAEDDPDAFRAAFLPRAKTKARAPEAGERVERMEDRPTAHVIACNGNKAVVQGDTACIDTVTGLTWSVGRMLSIRVGEARVVGVICDINMPGKHYDATRTSPLHFHVELQGEVREMANGSASFSTGISAYPGVGCEAHQVRSGDLEAIYSISGKIVARLGVLSQDTSVPAIVDVPHMLAKHFAVLGSTGSGKSASVTLLMQAMRALVPELRTIILDPHNEYKRAFPDASIIDPETLDIPFWMFQLDEYVEVLYRGRPPVHEEIEALREFIPQAKARFKVGDSRVALRTGSIGSSMTADTVAPYRLNDLFQLLDEEAGQLESRFDRSAVRALRARIAAHADDPRYAFMFRHRTISDISEHIVSGLFNLSGSDQRQTIVELSGMPIEVVNSVAAILARMTFELAVAARGKLKLLVLCEEAHRYVPVHANGFEPARRAIARIAKEGRKYGAFMGIISQRPSELDPTILSQCSTVFAMRLTNHVDQDIIRKAISSSSDSAVGFLSSLANQECIAFGEGAPTPMRMKFYSLPKHLLPGAESGVFEQDYPAYDESETTSLVARWRKVSG